MGTITLDHPLVHHKLSLLRDRGTGPMLFRQLLEELGLFLAVEASRGLTTEPTRVSTPLEDMDARCLPQLDPVLVPVLRAGLGLVPSFLKLMPTAKIGHLGLYRNHTSLQPVAYYKNLPPRLAERHVFVLDPMLATGGSASEALRQLKAEGAVNLSLVCLVGSPEGLNRLKEDHPDVSVVMAALDRKLNQSGYILPGLGDAGDRLFGTS